MAALKHKQHGTYLHNVARALNALTLNNLILDKNWQNSPSALNLVLPLLNDEEIFKKITTVLPTVQDDFYSESTTFKPFNSKRKAT